MSYFTDLPTPSFSDGSTRNGTPGGDRWARLLGGQIGQLSLPLHRVDVECSGSTKLKIRNYHGKHKIYPAAPKTHHEIHSSPATATTSRRLATKHVPRVSPYSPASIDPGFVKIALVQLSQSGKNTNDKRTQTAILNNGTLYAPRYEEAFCLRPKTV